jgi:tetratricopeptide (TPR) repeat protein
LGRAARYPWSVAILVLCALLPWQKNLWAAESAPGGSIIGQEATEEEIKQLFAESLRLLKVNRAYEARKLLERAALLRPGDPGIHCNLGLAYQNSGHLVKAVSEFSTALRLRPGMPEATLNMAGCYQSLGQTQEAISWYQRYLYENPGAADRAQVADIIQALKSSAGKPGSDPTTPDYFDAITADGAYRWPQSKLPIRIFIYTGAGVQGFRESFKIQFVEALDAWMRASQNRLAYVLVEDKNGADLVCDWTANPAEVSEAGTQSERGMAHIYATGGDIQRATLKILTRPMLEEGMLSDDDFKKACLHEIGHVLGLQGHSPNNHDVMFFTVDTSTVWPVLSKRDKATISRLYAEYPPLPHAPPVIPGMPKSAP